MLHPSPGPTSTPLPPPLLAPSPPPGGGGGPMIDEPPEAGSIHRAAVKRIEAYGVFVALEGYRKHGLVHSSQVIEAGGGGARGAGYLDLPSESTDGDKKRALGEVVTNQPTNRLTDQPTNRLTNQPTNQPINQPPAPQVSGYLDLSSESTDEDKKKALGEVVAIGDSVWVKVRPEFGRGEADVMAFRFFRFGGGLAERYVGQRCVVGWPPVCCLGERV